MSRNARKQDNKFKIDKVERDVSRDKKINGTVDRTRMSCILNLILNQNTLGEIVKDIADGILDFKEIQGIFPWKFVQELRRSTSERAQDEGNEFKNMTDERMKILLNFLLNRKSRDELLKLITDHSLSLDNIQKSYLRGHIEEEGESSTTMNVSTKSNKLSSKEANNTDSKNNKESKVTSTKKRNMVKKGEKDSNTKEKGNNLVEKAAKKVRVVKLKNEKRVGDINDGNKVEGESKELSSVEENPLPRVEDEKASNVLTESLMQNRHEGFEESSLKFSQGKEDRDAYNLLVRCDTEKTVKSKSLANEEYDVKLANGKKISEKIRKDVKPATRNKGRQKVGNNASSLWRNENYAEKEKEKSKSVESDEENEDKANNERFDEYLQKSGTNEIVNSFSVSSEKQSVSNDTENELNYDWECNVSTPKKSTQTDQGDTNTLTKLNGGFMVRIKEEPKSECSSNEFDQPNLDKILNINKNSKARTNTNKLKTSVSKSKKVTEPSKIATAKRNSNRGLRKTTERKTKDTERKESTEDKWYKMRKLDREERRKKKKLRRHEKRMAKAMAQFSDEAIKLVKKMGCLEENDESSFSRSSESSRSSSSESSCSSSSESSSSLSSESCSCSSCYDYSSDEYSEFTLCSCSNCGSSCTCSDFDREDEE